MRLTHCVSFDIELHDGKKFSVNLPIAGFDYWDWVGWYIKEGRMINRYLKGIGVDMYKSLAWTCSYRKSQFNPVH